MKQKGQRDSNRDSPPLEEDARLKDHRPHRRGAKTFRRGRALAFLERLNTKRSTLKKQLETPELQTIHPILVGELKATESIIDEFIQLFEINEHEETAEPKESEK